MKTQLAQVPKQVGRILGLFTILMFTAILSNPVIAQNQTQVQEKTIKGVISDDNGPLEGASIVLKGTQTGVVTDSKGAFTFPKPLKVGDVLLVSYLGYKTLKVKIKTDTTVLKITLAEDLVEFIGEVNTNTPYKSKRTKKNN
jgi:hypothetical protein